MYTLYYAPDNASLIVRLVFEELGQQYETILVNRRLKEQESASYKKINPIGLIPALDTPDGVMFETAAIILYLADKHGKLAPAPDSKMRAQFLSWLFFISNTLHTNMRRQVYPEKYATGDFQKHHQQSLKRINEALSKIEAMLITKPSWCDVNNPGIINFYIACLWRWLILYPKPTLEIPHPKRPLLESYSQQRTLLTALEERPSVIKLIQLEGLGQNPFTLPKYANPPEGSDQ